MTYLPLSMYRRQRRARGVSYARSEAITTLCAIGACVLGIASLMALCVALFSAKAEAAASPADSYALVMVYNAPTSWREVAALRGVSFAVCDAQQRAVWARDSDSVTLAGGVRVPRVDAYCVANDRLPSGVVTMAQVKAPMPMPAPRFAR